MTQNKKAPKCNQCDSSTISGVYCHELGCPNRDKWYNHESESWESVYKCGECGSLYDNQESAGECCNFESYAEEDEEETPLYDVFIRSWWSRDELGKLIPEVGEKSYIAHGVTRESARAICKNYNDTHEAGELSIMAEFESQ